MAKESSRQTFLIDLFVKGAYYVYELNITDSVGITDY